MKRIFFILIFLPFLFINLRADTIPNGGFENWVFNIWTEDPAFWTTNNSKLLAPTVVKDSDAYEGNLAMMLAFYGAFQPEAGCGFLLTSHPQNVGGYVKNNLATGDSMTFSILLFSNQQLVDSGHLVFYGGINPNYAPFVIPISQNSMNADSCHISIRGGMTSHSSALFDGLQLNFLLGIPEVDRSEFVLFPNPCGDFIKLKAKSALVNDIQIEAIDMVGRKTELLFDKEPTDDYIVELNTSSLKPGVWVINIRTAKRIHSVLLVKTE